jgi:uncharacterized protein
VQIIVVGAFNLLYRLKVLMMSIESIKIQGQRGPFTMERNLPIPMRDGSFLLSNLYRASHGDFQPVILTLGPYGKDVHLSQFMPQAFEELKGRCPEILANSTLKHLVFETPDPESWVYDGYHVLKIDSRGAGKSPGILDVNSPAEFQDLYDAIEWVGVQPWCNGRVGLLGISYYAAGQWMIASLKPPHLAAIIPWQGASDFYRDRTRQGGIFGSGFAKRWWSRSVLRNQFGNPDSPFIDIVSGERNTGPLALEAIALEGNRRNYIQQILDHPLDDDFYRERSPIFENINIPALVVANFGGLGLHLRGTVEGFLNIASKEKWLKLQTGSYFLTFLTPENVKIQKRFFDRYLKQIENNWEAEPRVEVCLRSVDDNVAENLTGQNWPLENIQWIPFYLRDPQLSLSLLKPTQPEVYCYKALSEGISFTLGPTERELRFAGPAVAKLYISSSSQDIDLFVTLRAFDESGKEVIFFSATEPRAPVSQGWLRASQRALDLEKSLPYRPYHAHQKKEPLVVGEIYEVQVEIWPWSLLVPKGYRLTLTIQGQDFERLNEEGEQRGSGWFLHNDPQDRPSDIFDALCFIHSAPEYPSSLLLPLVG